jgi:hypothetical protein
MQLNNPSRMKTGEISAIKFLDIYKDQRFKLKNGRVVWETLSWKGSKCYVSRIVKSGGKPFMLGLNFIGKYIDPEAVLVPVDVCPYCFDPECTSDHK